jgi:cholinesterase
MSRKPVVLMVATLLLASSTASTIAGPISSIVTFGDSNVDIGNAYNINSATVPPPNFNGRFSNGPLTMESVATALGVTVTNYGVAGAWSGTDNNFRIVGTVPPNLANTGVLNQLDDWEADLAGAAADPDALFVYWAGSNDLFEWFGVDLTLQERIDGVKANLATAMGRLDAGGARRILVGTRTPRDVLDNANDLRGQALNAEIRALIPLLDATYGASIELFDAYDIIAEVMRDPATFGFLATGAHCAADPACYTNPSVAATYINWDGAHKTTAVLSLLADRILEQLEKPSAVPVPGTLPLALLALGPVVALRRRHAGVRRRAAATALSHTAR